MLAQIPAAVFPWPTQSRRKEAMRSGGIDNVKLLLVMCWILLVSGQDTCHKCMYPVYNGDTQGSVLKTHTYLSPNCYDVSKLDTCKVNNKVYWLVKITESYSQESAGECPQTEGWVCFERHPGKAKFDDKRMKSDLVKEREVRVGEAILKREIEDPQLPTPGKNMFVDLIEKIGKELNVTNCWICGGTEMSEAWPWRGNSVKVTEMLRWSFSQVPHQDRSSSWNLNAPVIGEECLQRVGRRFKICVGTLACKRTWVTNGTAEWWVPKPPETFWARQRKSERCIPIESEQLYLCAKPNVDPFYEIPQISRFWKNIRESRDQSMNWQAPDGLYWICGKKAYSRLPSRWGGTCTLGIIQPFFFLLPKQDGATLGVPLYDELKREKRDQINVDIGGTQRWGEDEWPPERIIETYGPATWAQDGSWGYRTPVYMLNRIIRLQAVLELVTNKTATAFELIAMQQKQARTVIYQNRLALDYLLADEGGVCGKFNLSDCCIQIDDYGDAIIDIAKDMRKIAHVPVQTWIPIAKADWWKDLFGTNWWKNLGFILLCSLVGLIFLPCIIPCFIRLITTTVQGMQLVTVPDDSKHPVGPPQKVMLLKRNKKEEDPAKESKELYEQYRKWRQIYE